MDKINYSMYLVTDRKILRNISLPDAIEQAIKGGVTIVQLREKEVTSKKFYNLALKVKEITSKYNVPLIINDRIDIAMLVDADGVHLGQQDVPVIEARKIFGTTKIIGLSASNIDEAKKGVLDGADYLGVGAIFPTKTKLDAKENSIENLKNIKQEIKIPIVAIGGINYENIIEISKTGVAGAAMVSAILGNGNIEEATKNIKKIWTMNRRSI